MTEKTATRQDLLPKKIPRFQYTLDENGLHLESSKNQDAEFTLPFTGQPPGQQHNTAEFLLEIYQEDYNAGYRKGYNQGSRDAEDAAQPNG